MRLYTFEDVGLAVDKIGLNSKIREQIRSRSRRRAVGAVEEKGCPPLITIGMDTRISSDMLEGALIADYGGNSFCARGTVCLV